jgi:hypothetical protein
MTRTVWIIVAIAILALTLFIGFRLHGGQLWPSIWAIALGVVLVIALLAVSRSNEEFLNYFAFALCGGTLGWVIGILASPSTAQEERIFGEYKTAIMAFISGFAVTKLSDLWKMLTAGTPPMIFQATVLNRLLIFFGTFFLLVAQQYNVRQNSVGGVTVSASVSPAAALAGQTLGTVSVRPGATLTLKGFAAAPDMDVEWTINTDSTFAKAVSFTSPTIGVPATLPDGVKDGDKLQAIATSHWNRAKTASLDVVLAMQNTDQPVTPPAPDAKK